MPTYHGHIFYLVLSTILIVESKVLPEFCSIFKKIIWKYRETRNNQIYYQVGQKCGLLKTLTYKWNLTGPLTLDLAPILRMVELRWIAEYPSWCWTQKVRCEVYRCALWVLVVCIPMWVGTGQGLGVSKDLGSVPSSWCATRHGQVGGRHLRPTPAATSSSFHSSVLNCGFCHYPKRFMSSQFISLNTLCGIWAEYGHLGPTETLCGLMRWMGFMLNKFWG